MRRYRRKNKKQKKIIIISIVALTFVMITAYSAFQTTLSITAKGNVVDRSRTIKSWTSSSNEDFHTDFYKQNIVTATFLDSAKVPENAKEGWDVSVDKDGGVMAYVVESQTETGKYDLFIGAKDGVIANDDSRSLFANFTSLKTIDFGRNYDTTNVTNMQAMFRSCTNLTSLDVSNFKTDNLTDMFAMFELSGIENLDLSNFNTKNVTTMAWCFSFMNNLVSLNINSFDTSNVENMDGMFQTLKLNSIDLKHFDTSKVISMNTMFGSSLHSNPSTVHEIKGIENWDVHNVVNMNSMFQYMSNIESLNLCGWDTSGVTNMEQMFYTSPKFTNVYVGPNWTMTNVTNSNNMFYNSGVSSVTTGSCLNNN